MRRPRHGNGPYPGLHDIDQSPVNIRGFNLWMAKHTQRYPQPTKCAVCGKTALYREDGRLPEARGFCRAHKDQARPYSGWRE